MLPLGLKSDFAVPVCVLPRPGHDGHVASQTLHGDQHLRELQPPFALLRLGEINQEI